MPLGMEVGLGPGHNMLDGDRAPPTEMGTAAPTFAIYGRRFLSDAGFTDIGKHASVLSIVAKRLD